VSSWELPLGLTTTTTPPADVSRRSISPMRRLAIRRRRQRAMTADSPRSGFIRPWTPQAPCRTEPQRPNDETVVRTGRGRRGAGDPSSNVRARECRTLGTVPNHRQHSMTAGSDEPDPVGGRSRGSTHALPLPGRVRGRDVRLPVVASVPSPRARRLSTGRHGRRRLMACLLLRIIRMSSNVVGSSSPRSRAGSVA
jgi:hypothetical protein